MRIALFGSSQAGADVLRGLVRMPNATVVQVYASDARRDEVLGLDTLRATARDLSIPVKHGRPQVDIAASLESAQIDLILSVYYRYVIPDEILQTARVAALNLHPSALPKYRGPTPTAWALLQGEETVGITLHQMTSVVDAGDIVASTKIRIREEETGYQLHRRAMSAGVELVLKTLPLIESGQLGARPPKGKESFFGSLRQMSREISWFEPMELLQRKIRCFAFPYSGMTTTMDGTTVIVDEIRPYAAPSVPLPGPGIRLPVPEGKHVVSCADGFVELTRVRYELGPAAEAAKGETTKRTAESP